MPTTRVAGGVTGGGLPAGGILSGRFRSGGKHLDRPQFAALRGATEAVDLGRIDGGVGASSSLSAPFRRPGCSRDATRRGPRLVHGLCSRALDRGPSIFGSKNASLTRRHGFGRAGALDRTAVSSRWRIGRSFEGVPAHWIRCRNRQASPGPEKRSVDPFLTEHRPSPTGSSALTKPCVSPKGRRTEVTGERRSDESALLGGKAKRAGKTSPAERHSETSARAA
jgi:hypothetical protein